MIQHQWRWEGHTSPSGRVMYHCAICGLFDPAPVKSRYEQRPCEPGLYEGRFNVSEEDMVVTVAKTETGIGPGRMS